MVIIVGITAVAVILLIGIAVHFANGARSGRSGVLAQSHPTSGSATSPEKDRASTLN
jgi:hypothetical protein